MAHLLNMAIGLKKKRIIQILRKSLTGNNPSNSIAGRTECSTKWLVGHWSAMDEVGIGFHTVFVLPFTVESSASRVEKLCTGNPSSVIFAGFFALSTDRRRAPVKVPSGLRRSSGCSCRHETAAVLSASQKMPRRCNTPLIRSKIKCALDSEFCSTVTDRSDQKVNCFSGSEKRCSTRPRFL